MMYAKKLFKNIFSLRSIPVVKTVYIIIEEMIHLHFSEALFPIQSIVYLHSRWIPTMIIWLDSQLIWEASLQIKKTL